MDVDVPARRPAAHLAKREVAIYAPNGAVAPITPPRAALESPPVAVEVTDVRIDGGRVAFTATFDNRAPERWTGQDWVVVEVDASPLGLPAGFRGRGRGRGPEIAQWFGGLVSSSSATNSHTYEFHVPEARLAVRDDAGVLVPLDASEGDLGAGTWVLAIRLRHEWQPDTWRDVAVIPVLEITVSDDGDVSYAVFEDALDGASLPRTSTAP